MRLKCNGIEPTSIIYNGNEITHLKCNDIYVWGKPFKLNIVSLDESNVVVNRVSSPYENAQVGRVYNTDLIYYGDILEISDANGGEIVKFTVNGNNWSSKDRLEVKENVEIVIEKQGWKTVWSGETTMSARRVVIDITYDMKEVYSDPILSCSNDEVAGYLSSCPFDKIKISGQVNFINESSLNGIEPSTTSKSFNDLNLPNTISANATITLNRWGTINGMNVQGLPQVLATGIICDISDYSNTEDMGMIGNVTTTQTFSTLKLTEIKIYYEKF